MARDGVIIHIDGDDSGFRKSLSGIEGVAKKGLGVTLKGIAAVGTGFTAASVAALKFSGDLEQNLGGSKAVFEDFADTIEKKADDAFKNMGLSTSDYLATANKMGSLFKGAGFEIEESVNLTTEAMQRAADVASIMGIDTTWAMESIAGAAKGNFTMMDNLGVAMNDTTLNAYALEIGLGKTTQQMTNQEKVALAMEMFLDRTAYAAGNYARENETLAGALSTAKAALENFMAGTGDIEDLEESLKNASDVIVENIQELAPKLAEGLIEIVRGLIPVIPDILVELLPSIIDTIEELFGAAIDAIPDIIDKLADGIGDAVPILKPVTGLLSYLAEHIDMVSTVAISGASALATYKTALWGLAIVQQITGWFATTQKVLQGYTAAVATGASCSILLLGTMSPLQIAYGVLTGSISLADAAQAKFNLTVLKNPYVAVAAAVVALTVAIAKYAKTHKSASEEIRDSLDNIQREYEESVKASEEKIKVGQAEAAQADVLRTRLYDLESQIKSGTLTEEEAEAVQREFNATAAEMKEMIPGITNYLYDETGAIDVQRTSVDALTESYKKLVMVKAIANAYKDRIDAAAKAYADSGAQVNRAGENLEQLKSRQEKNPNAVNPGIMTQAEDDANIAVRTHADNYKTLSKATDDYMDALAEVDRITSESPELVKSAEEKKTGYVSSGNAARTQSAKNAAREQNQINKDQAEREYSILQRAHNRGEISDQEYYTKLAVIRNEYLEEGSEDWQEYTDEIYDGYADMLTKQKEAALEQLEEIQEAQQDLAKNLNKKNYLTKYTIEDKDGVMEFTAIGDYGKEAEQAEKALALLDEVEAKYGELPKEAQKALKEMDIAEATDFLAAMLNNPEQFEEAKKNWEREAAAYEEWADRIYEGEREIFAQKFEEVFGKVPEEFFDIGEEAALQFGEGLLNQLTEVFRRTKATIQAEMSNMSASFSTVGTGNVTTTNYTDKSVTNINVKSGSVRSAIEAFNQNTVFSKLVKSFGGK